MSISSVIAIIGGIVTAGCAIAGAIAGIRARKAQEARNEELKKAEHEARMQKIRDERNARIMESNRSFIQQTYAQPMQNPVSNEIHYYYHGLPQQVYYPNNYQPTNNYMNHGYIPSGGYSYGNSYNDTVYRREREIGNMSKMQMLQRFLPQGTYNQMGYYPQQHYAYAV